VTRDAGPRQAAGLRRFVRASSATPAAAPAVPGPAPAVPAPGPDIPAPAPDIPAPHIPAPAPDIPAPHIPAPAPDIPAVLAGSAREKCELCAAEVPEEHGHVADLESATLICACRACYLLFTHDNAGRGRYKAVPDRYAYDPDRSLPVTRWDQLDIPVGLAFFLYSSQRGEVTGFYPGPAGATECRLDLRAWDELAADYPLLAAVAPDVEATLVSRTDGGVECFLVPIDACYELAGRMRLHWRGFDGGAEARASIESFLRDVRQRARPLRREA
jgi:Family of unknown function (DUF5947)